MEPSCSLRSPPHSSGQLITLKLYQSVGVVTWCSMLLHIIRGIIMWHYEYSQFSSNEQNLLTNPYRSYYPFGSGCLYISLHPHGRRAVSCDHHYPQLPSQRYPLSHRLCSIPRGVSLREVQTDQLWWGVRNRVEEGWVRCVVWEWNHLYESCRILQPSRKSRT